MADIEKVIKGLEWVLENDRFGFGEHWTIDSEPRDEHEQAGYNITRGIELLKEYERKDNCPCTNCECYECIEVCNEYREWYQKEKA